MLPAEYTDTEPNDPERNDTWHKDAKGDVLLYNFFLQKTDSITTMDGIFIEPVEGTIPGVAMSELQLGRGLKEADSIFNPASGRGSITLHIRVSELTFPSDQIP
jgi:hypothetical protein